MNDQRLWSAQRLGFLVLSMVFSSTTAQGALDYRFYGSFFGFGDPIPGTAIEALFESRAFPEDPLVADRHDAAPSRLTPDQTSALTSGKVEWPQDGPDATPSGDSGLDNYGAAVSGILYPPTTGNYTFHLRSSANSALYFNPETAVFLDVQEASPIARETECCGAFELAGETVSESYSLEAGVGYAFELLWKADVGEDWMQVGWRFEDGPVEVIPAFYVQRDTRFGFDEDGITFPTSDRTLSVEEGRAFCCVGVEFDKTSAPAMAWSVSKDEGETWELVADDGNMIGANSPALQFSQTDLSWNGWRFRAEINGETSAVYTLNVTEDSEAPEVVDVTTVGTLEGGRIRVEFSEAVAEASALNAANYSLTGEKSIESISKESESVVLLDIGAFDLTPFEVTISGVTDVSSSANPVESATFPISFEGSTSAPIDLLGELADVSVEEGSDIVVVAPIALAEGVQLQWIIDGAVAPNETGQLLTFENADASLSGTTVQVAAYNSNGAFNVAMSNEATLTVAPDTTAPTVVETFATRGGVDGILIRFDEPLNPQSVSIDRFTVSALTLNSVSLREGDTVVYLETSDQGLGQTYDLFALNLEDASAARNTYTGTTTFTSSVSASSDYGATVLVDRPLVYYRFNEDSGQIATNLGTLGDTADGQWMSGSGPANSVMTDVNPGEGPRPSSGLPGFDLDNAAASFDGASSFFWIDTQNSLLSDREAFTIEYWVQSANRAAQGDRIGVVGQNDAVEHGFIDPDTVQTWTPGGGMVSAAYDAPNGEWRHVATVADGESISVYLDGDLIAEGETATSNYGASSSNVHIGGGGIFDDVGNHFSGLVDEVAIYDTALAPERIQQRVEFGLFGAVSREEPIAEIESVTLDAGQLTIVYSGTLESASNVEGPYDVVPNASSPYVVSPAGGAVFFRVR